MTHENISLFFFDNFYEYSHLISFPTLLDIANELSAFIFKNGFELLKWEKKDVSIYFSLHDNHFFVLKPVLSVFPVFNFTISVFGNTTWCHSFLVEAGVWSIDRELLSYLRREWGPGSLCVNTKI